MKKICPRCGNSYVRLDSHLKNKVQCKAIYVNVNRNNIIKNYDSLLEKYHKIKEQQNKTYVCDICNKRYLKKNKARHIKLHERNGEHPSVSSNTNEAVPTTIVYGDQINNINNNINNNQYIINVIFPNNFSQENNIDSDTAFKLFNKYVELDDKQKIKYIESKAFGEYFEELHLKGENNKNIYLPNYRNKYGYMFNDNCWQDIEKNKLLNISANNTLNNMREMLTNVTIELDNIENKSPLELEKKETFVKINGFIELLKSSKRIFDNPENTNLNGEMDWRKAIEEVEQRLLRNKQALRSNYMQTKKYIKNE